jgi:glycosyltransferase 2 family protein
LLQQVSIAQVGDALGHARLLPVLALVACVMGSLVTRAARWQVYFRPQRQVPFKPLLGTLAISYMASTFLPLRAGELVRAVFLGQRERIPVPAIVGTILVEKLFDFLAIGVILAVLLVVQASSLPPAAQVAGVSITSVILIGFGFVVALAIWREPTLNLVGFVERHIPLGHKLRLRDAARNFAEGTDSLREGRLWLLLLGWTAITWVFSIGSTLAGMVSLNVPPDIPMALFVVVLTSTGQAVPSSPGYVGVYHAAATLALTTFGVDTATALGVALITHAFSYGSLVVVGLIALWTGGYTFSDVLKGVRSRSGVAAPVSVEL